MRKPGTAGMTLVEVIVAIAVFATACLAAAHLVVLGMRTVQTSGASTVAVAAAAAKIEELHSLVWRFDEAGERISDPALALSPSDALQRNIAGFADYLDQEGQPAGAGVDPPPGAVYVRRWALRPLAAAPDDTLVIQVLVVPRTDVGSPNARAATGGAATILTTARGRTR
jgi:prepilin-type N-terminal cleavage/methylation domain-containing protein